MRRVPSSTTLDPAGPAADLLARPSPYRRGERRLMLGVLEDAVRILQRPGQQDHSAKAEVLAWVDGTSLLPPGDPFTFENVCTVLGLTAAYISAGMHRLQQGAVCWAIGPRTAPVLRHGRARHLAAVREQQQAYG